ncbi:hypothetical protein, partial [Microbulbifer thermotolerans]|uniref:hypothetical protein n=1 Tax=Microbulbifer thermotolerans TaxID=252514 RepID=UPI002249A25C
PTERKLGKRYRRVMEKGDNYLEKHRPALDQDHIVKSPGRVICRGFWDFALLKIAANEVMPNV